MIVFCSHLRHIGSLNGLKRVKGGMLEQNKARKWIRRGRNMYVRIITHHFMPSEKSTFTVFCYVSTTTLAHINPSLG